MVGGGRGGGTPLSSHLEREWGERKRVFMYLFKNSCTYLCKISLKLWGSSELWHKNKSIDASQKIFMEFGWLFVAVVQASPLWWMFWQTATWMTTPLKVASRWMACPLGVAFATSPPMSSRMTCSSVHSLCEKHWSSGWAGNSWISV